MFTKEEINLLTVALVDKQDVFEGLKKRRPNYTEFFNQKIAAIDSLYLKLTGKPLAPQATTIRYWKVKAGV